MGSPLYSVSPYTDTPKKTERVWRDRQSARGALIIYLPPSLSLVWNYLPRLDRFFSPGGKDLPPS